MAYEQTLYKVIEPIKRTTIHRLNKSKSWKYGYNKEHDVIVISKTGKIGEIYEIQNLKIALPLAEDVYSKHDKWTASDLPIEFKRIQTIFDWETYPREFKEKWYAYIDKEFTRRDEGYWFSNKGNDTYITGTHYMYLQWSKIDVGRPEFREANRLFFIFWEACKADTRCYGICYLKNRRSGFSFMSSSETVNQATISSDSRRLEQMQKKCLPTKLYPYQPITHFSLNQYKMEWIGLKQNWLIEYQHLNLQENQLPKIVKGKYLKD